MSHEIAAWVIGKAAEEALAPGNKVSMQEWVGFFYRGWINTNTAVGKAKHKRIAEQLATMGYTV